MSLSSPVAARLAVLGDSNVVVCAKAIIDACGADPNGGDALAVDFVAAVSGTALVYLDQIVNRLYDVNVRCGGHDAFVFNWGVNDIGLSDADFAGYYHGTAPGGMHFARRIAAVLEAVPEEVGIYWIGVPQGLPVSPWHPYEIAAINLTLRAFEDPAAVLALDPVNFGVLLNPDGGQPDARFRYVDPDALIGATSPKFLDGVHYSEAAAGALWRALATRIRTDLA